MSKSNIESTKLRDQHRFEITTAHINHLLVVLDNLPNSLFQERLQEVKYPSQNTFLIKLWDHKLAVEWAADYLIQLWRQWVGWYNANTPPFGFPLDTFILLKLEIIFLLEKFKLPPTPLEEFTDDQRLQYWEVLEDHEVVCGELTHALMGLSRELEARTSAAQILGMMEPFLNIGEQSGLQDLVTDSAGRLFRAYCTLPRKKNESKGTENWEGETYLQEESIRKKRKTFERELIDEYYSPSEETLTDKNNKSSRYSARLKKIIQANWRGIVSSSSGEDFNVRSSWRTLELPVRFKSQIENELPILAHEASHFICFVIDKILTIGGPEFSTYGLVPLFQNAFRSIISEVGEDAENLERMIEQFPEPFLKFLVTALEETLCDILACLTAGPAFCRSLGIVIFSPFEDYQHCENLIYDEHPYSWMRLELCLQILESLEYWDRNSTKEIEDPWELNILSKVSEEHYKKAKEIWEKNWMRTGKFFIRKLDRIANSVMRLNNSNKPEEIRKIEKIFDKLYDIFFRDPQVNHLMTYFICKSLKKQPKCIYPLLYWLDRNGQRFLFYPPHWLWDKKAVRKDIDDFPLFNNEKHKLLVRGINHYCFSLAERMFFDSSLVLDAPLKYIAAASSIPLIRRPLYPTGQVLLSLFYSENDWGTFDHILNPLLPPDWVGQEFE